MTGSRSLVVLFCLAFIASWLILMYSIPLSATGNTLQGVVLDAASNPIGGIEVILWERNTTPSWQYLDVDVSDALTGAFSFANLADGDYTLEYSDPTGTWLHQYHVGHETIGDADPISLTGGATEAITATLQRAASLEGIVTDDAQPPAPLSSVPVTLWREVGDAWIAVENTFTTNNDGVFRAIGLAAGVYRLHIGYSGGGEFFDIWYPNAATLEEAESVVLDEGEQGMLADVRLPRKSTIAGSLALPAGMARDGIRVCAVTLGTPTSESTGAPTACASDDLTDGDGLFEIPNLRAGEFMLYIEDDAFPQRILNRWYPASPDNAPLQTLTLSSGETLQVAPIPVLAAHSVFGTVLSAQGTAANGVQVRLYEATDDGLRWDHTAWTDTAGQFDLQLRRPSTWTVGYFDASGAHAPLYFPSIETIADADVTSVPTETHSLNAGTTLVTGRTLQGRVVDGNGMGLAGVEVHVFFPAGGDEGGAQGRWMPEWLRSVTTNASGEYVIGGLGVEPVLLYFEDSAGLLQDKWYGAGGAAANSIGEATSVLVAAGGTTLAAVVLAEAASTAPAPGGNWQIRNQATGVGIEGARITLYWLPGWRAQVDNEDDEPYTCPTLADAGDATVESLSPSAIKAFASAGILQPDANPQISNATGGFGWQVTPGCWQVRAEATGYYSVTSAAWGVGVGQIEMPTFSLALARIGGEPTPTSTSTPTPTATQAPSETPTQTPSRTPVPTNTPTATSTSTSTATTSSTPVSTTAASTPTATPSSTGMVTPSATPTVQSHGTPNGSSTPTFTATPTDTSEHTPTFTPTATQTPEVTGEPTSDATSEPSSLNLTGIIFADQNRNGRQDDNEAGISGVHLQIEVVANLETAGSGAWQSEAVTDNVGRFTFRDVPAGEYRMRVTPPIGMALLTPATLPLVVSGRDGEMPALHVGVAMEPAPVLLPLIGK